MGVILLIISIWIKNLIGKAAWLYSSIRAIHYGGYKEWLEWNKELAIANDRYGNVLLKYPLNEFTIKEDGYKFGNSKETISSAIGKNEVIDKLKPFGEKINNVLSFLDKNHSIESIDNNV